MDLLLVVFLPTEKAYEYESDHRSNEHYLNSSENKALFTAQEVFITAKIAFVFTSLSAVQIYDFHIFTVVWISIFLLLLKQCSLLAAKIPFINISWPIHIYDFHIFIVIYSSLHGFLSK